MLYESSYHNLLTMGIKTLHMAVNLANCKSLSKPWKPRVKMQCVNNFLHWLRALVQDFIQGYVLAKNWIRDLLQTDSLLDCWTIFKSSLAAPMLKSCFFFLHRFCCAYDLTSLIQLVMIYLEAKILALVVILGCCNHILSPLVLGIKILSTEISACIMPNHCFFIQANL